MKSLAIIPARYDSTRFPGKPLVLISGKPMIYWVYQQCLRAGFNEVVVATDDQRIVEAVSSFGGKVQMTRADHPSGTSRCMEVSASLAQYDIVINVQGDEPLVDPMDLNRLIRSIELGASIASLYEQISADEADNPNNVKVVLDKDMNALYFSRSLIPYPRVGGEQVPYKKHVGVYAFNRSVLESLSELPTGTLSEIESLEQLNWMEEGFRIKMFLTEMKNIGVDTPEDLEELQNRIDAGEISLG